jgi:hypothetical protein
MVKGVSYKFVEPSRRRIWLEGLRQAMKPPIRLVSILVRIRTRYLLNTRHENYRLIYLSRYVSFAIFLSSESICKSRHIVVQYRARTFTLTLFGRQRTIWPQTTLADPYYNIWYGKIKNGEQVWVWKESIVANFEALLWQKQEDYKSLQPQYILTFTEIRTWYFQKNIPYIFCDHLFV